MRVVRLDSMTVTEIKEYLDKSYTTVALIEFAYDGYYLPVVYAIDAETEISEVISKMMSHKEAVNNEPLYTLFIKEGGEIKQIHGYDAEKWVDETLPELLEEIDFEGSDLLDPDQGNDNMF